MARDVAVIGDGVAVAQAALTLAEMGMVVTVVTPSAALGLGPHDTIKGTSGVSAQDIRIWPLVLRAASHPLVKLYTNAEVSAIHGKRGHFTIRAVKRPRYVHADLCSACGRCTEVCPVKALSRLDSRRVTYSAIHTPLLGAKAVPSAYCIDKNGVAPCRAACPLGINVHGLTSLLAKGKVQDALSLINEAAPLARVLGRVCTHPCEYNCKRGEVDSPVFIQALHRYAGDNAPGSIEYSCKSPAGSRKEKIAIVGSGPAGLTAAWELARRGYSPTIFESHAVVGGMLATGIPRFRLPREVRERDVEAIKALGVDMKTGVTVGRDVTFSDLKERGYQAFFLAIGAQQNIPLNIPGEDLDGVVDSISLLFALNQKVGAPVGSNVVVIGGGNSAVDSARAAKRRSKGTVRIIYRRTAEEMTATKEDVEEALQEGISVEYLTAPVEIMGEGGKVSGIRCQRMALGETEADGRRRPKPIAGSVFVIEADHVVVAIGQWPSTSLLNIKGLEIDSNAGTVKVDQVTGETSIPGIFAGGDCVTGPNNVVQAMAAGLRAAESIDRYLGGHDLREGRSLEEPRLAQVNVKERPASPHKRARMASIHRSKRMRSFDETTLGLRAGMAVREAGRCLNCALCSECLECEQACELGAVCHGDTTEQVEIAAAAIICFASAAGSSAAVRKHRRRRTSTHFARPGVYTVQTRGDGGLLGELAGASAVALEAAMEIKLNEEEQPVEPRATAGPDVHLDQLRWGRDAASAGQARIGVVLCRCCDSISSVIDFKEVARKALGLGGVCRVQEVSQACSEEGARQIGTQASEWELTRVVVAACRCCNLEQICFSCTDKRVMCQRRVSHSLGLPYGTAVEFVNIREQCAWVHADDPVGATRKATQMVSSGVARVRELLQATYEQRPVEKSALVLGAGLCGLAAAKALAAQGYSVAVVSRPDSRTLREHQSPQYLDRRTSLLQQLEDQGTHVRPWPRRLELGGSPGSYEAVLRYGSQVSRMRAGAVVVELAEIDGEAPPAVSAIPSGSLLGRILARVRSGSTADANYAALRDLSINVTSGIFIIAPDAAQPPEEQVLNGAALAARASAYLGQGVLNPPASATTINSKLCRGCGDCVTTCPYIEIRQDGSGMACAYIDQALCLGCGACIARCPTGAITQPVLSDRQIIATLEALLRGTNSAPGLMGRAAEVVVFACNWDGLSCVEAVAQAKLRYPASVRVMRVSCLSRVHSGLMLKAFELGADGVMLLGCEPGNCYFDIDATYIVREYGKAREVMRLLGLEEQRLALAHLARGDGSGFVSRVMSFIAEIEQIRPASRVGV